MDRLYVIVDNTLATGLKIAQACHAVCSMMKAHPDVYWHWHENSNNIVVLEHDDITGVANELESLGMKTSKFFEPDLDDRLTAFAVEPRAYRYLSNVKLAG